MNYSVNILETEMLNHNVKRFRTKKPAGFEFEPGQATDLVLSKEKDLAKEKRPFTFTSLPEDSWLEFTIKMYPDHEGVTDRLLQYEAGDVFQISDAWGAINYRGPGVFLAGGAGITPFLSILRAHQETGELDECELWFSNKTAEDVFLEDELRSMLGDRLSLIFTDHEADPDATGPIDHDYLENNISNYKQYFYICGPDQMVEDLSAELESLGVSHSRIVTEDFN